MPGSDQGAGERLPSDGSESGGGRAPGRGPVDLPGPLDDLSKLGFTVIGMLAGVMAFKFVFTQLVVFTESLEQMPSDDKMALFFGALLGIVFTALVTPVINQLNPEPWIGSVLVVVTGFVLLYLSTQGALSMKTELRRLLPPYGAPAQVDQGPDMANSKLLDTNVIIDGRIADICRAGFIQGTIYVPGFVLDELQQIADSAEQLKRARGRRGLDILNQMQKELPLVVRSLDHMAVEQPGELVDARLVRLAKALGGQIVTNDYNLNKVSELQGVAVLNVNELANALKPVVMPGEEFEVRVIKEGREPNQGIAYLDDGTMVVIENGKRFIGETVTVAVGSVIQTVAGKMIFGALRDLAEAEQDLMDRNLHAYSPAARARRGRTPT
ncbi:MAG: TRAM domain-containing protein [Armatimonadetes bacterium]|nr:TRAM domain-containing protein [Armatimonadota bacterium]